MWQILAVAVSLLAACSRPERPPAPVPGTAIAPAPDAAPAPAGPRRLAMSDRVELQVDVAGAGPPCLYVHGGPGQGVQSFRRMRGDRLERLLTMIYVDQRGSGQSASAADYSLERVVDDLEEVRRALGHERVYLLSHSFGGVIATRYAEKYPDRVRGLILVTSTLAFPAAMRSQLGYLRGVVGDRSTTPADASFAVLVEHYDRARALLRDVKTYVPLLAAEVETLRAMGAVDTDPPRNRELGRFVIADPRAAAYLADLRPRSAQIRVPVLAVSGTRDHAIGADHADSFRFPDQTVVHIDGSHMLYYENSDELVAVVERWLAPRISEP